MRRSDVAVNFMVDVCSVQQLADWWGGCGMCGLEGSVGEVDKQKLWSAINEMMCDCHKWFLPTFTFKT